MSPQVPSFRRLYLLLCLFTMGAVAINLFMLGLMIQGIGLPHIPPVTAVILSLPLGALANIWVTRWVLGLIREADGT